MSTHPDDPDGWEFLRGRKSSEHIDNCATGYMTPGNFYREVHHILPVSSCQDATISDLGANATLLKRLRKCMAITVWNINAEHNVISLPKKEAYICNLAPPGWDMLPCHRIGHNPDYTDAVSQNLYDTVWTKVEKITEKCKFDPQDLKKKMEGASTRWRNYLTRRGAEEGGTKKCWANQLTNPEWYRPFSMAPDPKPRKGVNYAKLTGSLQDKLEQLFQLLKS